MAEFNFIVCDACGVEFGIPTTYDNKRRQNGESFYCPGGHSMSYGEGENKKLRRERNRLKQRLAEKDDAIREEQTVPIRLTHTPTTCSVCRWKSSGNQGLREL